ncbi:hypothetical protein BC830DRAFT_1099946 [Chytriomyces sp. MP71]|nr:hypothetical protein BC830DRAFT_1099946 [Chytriomyces sp. MP71]
MSKYAVMEGFESLSQAALELENDIIFESKAIGAYHASPIESLINPWVLDKEEGDVRRLIEYNCADSGFTIKKFEELKEAQVKCKQQLLDLKNEYRDYQDDLDGWKKDMHFRFEKVRIEYKSIKESKLYTNRLEIEFPTMSKSQLKFHMAWIQKHNGYKARHTALTKTHHALMNNLVKSIIQQFPIVSRQYLHKMKTEFNQYEFLEKMEERHRKLQEWRKKRIEEIQIEEATREYEAIEDAALNAAREERRRRQVEAKKAAIHKFQAERREEQLEKIREYEETKRQEAILQANMKPYNQERVNYRAFEHFKKLDIARQEQLEKERRREEIERKLELLRASVAVRVESDWNRILRPTESFKVAKETEKLPSLFVNNSYTVAALMKDRRFRISEALHAAGLQNSTAAHELMMKMNLLNKK